MISSYFASYSWSVEWSGKNHVPFEEISVTIWMGKQIGFYLYAQSKTNWLPAVMNYKSNTEVGASNADVLQLKSTPAAYSALI